MKPKKNTPAASTVDPKLLRRQILEAREEASRTEEAAVSAKAKLKRLKKACKHARKAAKRARKTLKALLAQQKATAPRKARPARTAVVKRLVPRNAATLETSWPALAADVAPPAVPQPATEPSPVASLPRSEITK